MTQAQRAAQPLVPEMPQRRDGSVGQFAFAAENHVRNILQSSGWTQISIKPLDLDFALLRDGASDGQLASGAYSKKALDFACFFEPVSHVL